MDTLIYIVLLAGAIIGFCQGAFKQAAQCAGIILGLVMAASLYQSFGDMLADKNINFFNRLAGAVIGAACYGLLLSVALNLYDFVNSNAGFKPEKLEEKAPIYYTVKQASHIVLPDILIVTDSTEVANGEQPKYGLKSVTPDFTITQ